MGAEKEKPPLAGAEAPDPENENCVDPVALDVSFGFDSPFGHFWPQQPQSSFAPHFKVQHSHLSLSAFACDANCSASDTPFLGDDAFGTGADLVSNANPPVPEAGAGAEVEPAN